MKLLFRPLVSEDAEEVEEEKDSSMFDFFGWFSDDEVQKSEEKMKPDCPPNGIFEVGPCKNGAPIAVSWPMFYKADPKFRNDIDGDP